MRERWVIRHEDTMPEIPEAENPEYELLVGTSGANPPYTYYAGEGLTGYDIELARRFAVWMNASLTFKVYDYDGIIPAANSGDIDCIFANLFITPERSEAIEFSEPTYVGEVGVMVTDAHGNSVFSNIRESFHKTFVREGRWKLFASGIGTTILITVLSVLLGTMLGFAVFMLCRKGYRIANVATRFAVWLIQGMPVVVLLMILYYIVFSDAGMSGTAVSVVAFTLIFAAAVYSMLKAGVGAVDAGQMEAAYSLGYTDRNAFYRIILPQAMPHSCRSLRRRSLL